MLNRRSLLVSATVLALATLAAPALAENVLRVGISSGYPPFDVLNADGTLSGFDVDYAKLLCERMGKTCEFVDIEWDGIIPGLLAKKFDVIISSMGINEERMKQVDFTNPYYKGPASLITAKGAGYTADAAGTKGKRIGVQRASAHECYMHNNMPDAEMVQYATQEEANLDLMAGRIDAILVDAIPGDAWLKSDPAIGGAYAPIKDDLYDVQCYGIGNGIALRKGEEDLRKALDDAIQKTRDDGSYVELSNKYFGRDIYGN